MYESGHFGEVLNKLRTQSQENFDTWYAANATEFARFVNSPEGARLLCAATWMHEKALNNEAARNYMLGRPTYIASALLHPTARRELFSASVTSELPSGMANHLTKLRMLHESPEALHAVFSFPLMVKAMQSVSAYSRGSALTANNAPSGYAASASSAHASHPAWHAFDYNGDTFWCESVANGGEGAWCAKKFPEARIITQVQYLQFSDASLACGQTKRFLVEAKVNGNWMHVATVENAFRTAHAKVNFINTIASDEWRILNQENLGSGKRWGLRTLEFYGVAQW